MKLTRDMRNTESDKYTYTSETLRIRRDDEQRVNRVMYIDIIKPMYVAEKRILGFIWTDNISDKFFESFTYKSSHKSDVEKKLNMIKKQKDLKNAKNT